MLAARRSYYSIILAFLLATNACPQLAVSVMVALSIDALALVDASLVLRAVVVPQPEA